jgi:uncharacterized protein YjhX (UPF0386 family)
VKFKYDRRGHKLELLAERLKGAGHVKIGVLGDAAKESREGFNMAALAATHEYGAPSVGIPERAPIRNSIRVNKAKYRAMIAKFTSRILNNKMSTTKALELLGMKAVADVRKYIRDGHALPANTPEVFMQKLLKGKRGFNRTGKAPVPLIDTAQLLNSYTFEVVPK